MAITLDNGQTVLALPDNLVWQDEYAWTPVAQSLEYSLSGAVLFEESTKLAGRPVTLSGGPQWAWLTRTELETLRTLLDEAALSLTLTLHDARTLTVTPDRSGTGPVEVEALPVIAGSGPADPSGTTQYALLRLKLLTLE